MSKLIKLAALAVALALSPVAFAQDKKADDKKDEKVDNLEYAYWAKFKAGSSSVLKMSSEANGMKFSSTITTKLEEVKDDKLVLEASSVNTFNGMEIKGEPMKRDVPKQLDKALPGADPKSGKPDGTTEEGKEKVKVGGTEYECKWYKFKQKLPAGDDEVEGQIWMSEDVPGRLVKMTSKTKAGSMTMEATEVTIKK